MEIEKRAFIKNKDEVIQKLTEMGGEKIKDIHIIDYWLCRKSLNKFEDAKQHERGSYGLRIRKNIFTENVVWEINCKILDKENDHNAFNEIESKIEDGESIINILVSTEFKVFCKVDKIREIYSLNNISINLEKIKDYADAIELEIIDDANIDENKKKLDDLLIKLGIKEKDLIEKSITYLYMEEFSFK